MEQSHVAELTSEIVRAGVTPGAAVCVSVAGRRISGAAGISGGTAPLTADSRFQLGCITKVLTALVALELSNAGRMELDAPVSRYLPELHDIPAFDSVQVRHLLAHTSGYQGVNIADPAVRYFFSWPKLLAQFRSSVRLFAPGTVFSYEHTECIMLGEIAQRITGAHIHALYRQMIWDPLDIKCGTFETDAGCSEGRVEDHSFDAVSGRYVPLRPVPYCKFWDASLSNLTLSLSDLVTLGEAIAGFDRRATFASSVIARLRDIQVRLPRSFGGRQRELMPLAFGNGCAQYQAGVFGHNGSARGQTCALRFDIDSQLVMAVGLSCWRPQARDLVCDKIIAAVSGAPPGTPPGAAEHIPVNVSGHYVGAAGMSVDVTESDTQLICRIESASPRTSVRVTIARSERGGPEVSAESVPHLTVGFFDTPCEHAPALMVALNAYRRVSL